VTKFFDDDELVAFIKEPCADDTKKALASLRGLIKERDDANKELETAKDRIEELEDVEGELVERDEALSHVRYWFHDVLILNKPMTPPRRILAIVERAMGL
jgi:hypothetical protein